MPLEIVVGCLVLVAAADFNYFTWWGFLVMVSAQAIDAMPVKRYIFERIHTLWLCVAFLISLSMPVMSVVGCSTLVDQSTVAGPWLYVSANFLLHYWPSVRAVSMMPPSPPPRITLDAAAMTVFFVLLYDPAATYSCATLDRWQFMVGAGVAGTIVEVCAHLLRKHLD